MSDFSRPTQRLEDGASGRQGIGKAARATAGAPSIARVAAVIAGIIVEDRARSRERIVVEHDEHVYEVEALTPRRARRASADGQSRADDAPAAHGACETCPDE